MNMLKGWNVKLWRGGDLGRFTEPQGFLSDFDPFLLLERTTRLTGALSLIFVPAFREAKVSRLIK